MPDNQILPFCPTDTGTNLTSQSDYEASGSRTSGQTAGIASSKLNNKALRQATFIAAGFAQYIANQSDQDVLDNGDLDGLEDQIASAFDVIPSSKYISNLGLNVSISANQLVILVTNFDGSTPTGGNNAPVLAFRSLVATDGTYTIEEPPGPLSITVPVGATLGQASGVNQFVFVYMIFDGTGFQLGVSGVKGFNDDFLADSTTISSGSTDGSTIYSTNGVSQKAIRLIGVIDINEPSAGTWSVAPISVSVDPSRISNQTNWTNDGPVTIEATSSNPSKGTATIVVDRAWYRRLGCDAEIRIEYKHSAAGTATAGAGDYLFKLPGGLVADVAKAALYTTVVGAGAPVQPLGALGCGFMSQAANNFFLSGGVYLYDSTHVRLGGIAMNTNFSNGSQGMVSAGLGALNNSEVSYALTFRVPIIGWWVNGP